MYGSLKGGSVISADYQPLLGFQLVEKKKRKERKKKKGFFKKATCFRGISLHLFQKE